MTLLGYISCESEMKLSSRNGTYTTSRLVGLAFPPILICIHGLLGDRHHKVRDKIFLSVRAIKDCVPGRDLGLCSWLHYFVFCREDSMAKRKWNDVYVETRGLSQGFENVVDSST